MEHDNEKTSSALTSCIRFGGGRGAGFLNLCIYMYVSRPFSVVPSNRTRSYGHKQKHKKFRLNMQKTFFLLRVAEP